ncbi:MAG: hypothetical protein K6T16_01570 [Candidatus Pacearchaeota archaeon]|nr:hypothetical protein [Candidatus Pacearchaeota archaeon]
MAITEFYEEYDFLGNGIGEAPPELEITQFMDMQGFAEAIGEIAYIGITTAYTDIGDISGILDKIKKGLKTVKDKIVGGLKKGKDFIVKTVKGAIKKGKEAWEKAKAWGKRQWEKLKGGAKELYEKAKKKAKETYEKLKPKAKPTPKITTEKPEPKPKVPTVPIKEATHKLEIRFLPLMANAVENLSRGIGKVKTIIKGNLPFGWKLLETSIAEGNKLNIYLRSPAKIGDFGLAPAVVPIALIGGILISFGLIILGWKWIDLTKEKVVLEEAKTKKELINDIMTNPNITPEQKDRMLNNLTKEGLIEPQDKPELLSLFGLPTWATIGLIGLGAFLLLSPKSPVQIIHADRKRR